MPNPSSLFVPGKWTLSFLCGTIHWDLAEIDDKSTPGRCSFDPNNREIAVQLNVRHQQINAAMWSGDQKTLEGYIAAVCLSGVRHFREQSGYWPWPHDNWPDVMSVWESLEHTVRSLGNVQ